MVIIDFLLNLGKEKSFLFKYKVISFNLRLSDFNKLIDSLYLFLLFSIFVNRGLLSFNSIDFL